MVNGNIAVYNDVFDCFFFVIGNTDSNELVLSAVLETLYESVTTLLKQQIDKISLLENLELILLAMDEIVDGGVIFETDAMKVANRVLMDVADSEDDEFSASPQRKRMGTF